jgi:ATP-dependent Lon protease
MSKSTCSAELRTMPVLAVRGIVVFPGMIVQFDIGRKKSVLAVKAALDTPIAGAVHRHADGPLGKRADGGRPL